MAFLQGDVPLARIARNTGWLLGGKGLGSVLSLVYLAILARTLGTDGFGQFALVFVLAQAITQLTSFDSWRIIVRYGADHLARSEKGAFARLGLFATLLDAGAAIIGCIAAAIAVALIAPRFAWDPQLARYALWFAWAMLLTIRSAPMGILRVHDRFRDSASADAVTPVFRFIGAMGVLAVGATLERFLMAWAIAEVATACAYWLLALRARPFAGEGRWRLSSVKAENPGIWRFTLLTNLGSTLTAAQQQLPLLVIGFFAGPASAGLFRLAHQLGQALQRLADMLARALFAEQARTHARDGEAAGRALHERISGFAWQAGGIIVAAVATLGYPALLLIGGSEFTPAYPLLLLLGGAAALQFVVVGYEPLLLAKGRAGSVLAIQALIVAFMAAALLLLVPPLGSFGAGIATLAAAIAALLLWRASTRAG